MNVKTTISVTALVTATLLSTAVSAQKPEFNRWSLEAAFGVHKPFSPYTAGYSTNPVNFFSVSAGTRFMPGEKFGFMLDVGYDQIKAGKNSNPFQSVYSRASLQGVINFASLFEFHNWTDRIGLLGHAGAGVSNLSPDKLQFGNGSEGHLNLIAGITPQVRLSDRVVLTADLSVLATAMKERNFDFKGETSSPGIDGNMLQGKIGITVYLGKNRQHADWYHAGSRMQEQIDSLRMGMAQQQERIQALEERTGTLEERVTTIEGQLNDSDNDGVADKFDLEPNSSPGVDVNTKGQEIKSPVLGNESLDPLKGLFFTVQLGVYSQEVPSDVLKNITPLDRKTMPDGKIRYFSGVYHSVEEATVKLQEAQKAGISDAFITAYYKGERITVAEARAFLQERGPEILEKKR